METRRTLESREAPPPPPARAGRSRAAGHDSALSRALLASALLLFSPARAVSVGDTLLLLPCGGADAQRQVFRVFNGSGALPFHIETSAPNLVLDIAGPSNASGAPLHVWGSYSPPVANQMWDLAGGSITSRYNGMCVAFTPDGSPGEPPIGSSLVIADCAPGAETQRFSYDAGALTLSPLSAPSLCVQAVNATPTCDDAPFSGLPYCNASLPVEARVADLLARMTPQEKAAALDAGVPAIARLGVPSMHSGEALHGPATGCVGSPAPNSTGCPTSFPCPTALGAAFDEALWLRVGLAIGTEARALSNLNAGAVWLFMPNINPARDPRWGRTQEVASEDAALIGSYGQAIVRGVQGEGGSDPGHLLAATTLKHWVAYDLEGYIPRTDPQPRPASAICDTPSGCQRWNMDALVNARDLNAYFAAPFAQAIKAGARSVMCAYNAVQGAPACGSPLLNSMLRDGLGWNGHVVSDCTAIELMGDAKYDNCKGPYPPNSCVPDNFPGHNFTHGVVETANAALAAGTDVNCGPFYRMWLEALLTNGSVPAAAVDLAVTRVYRTAVMLGLLDPSSQTPYSRLGAESIDSAAHRELALVAARESIVLLKNDGQTLPLKAAAKVAFIGPHANSTQAFLANYHGDNELVNSHSPLMVAAARGLSVTYSRGCNICDVVPGGFPNMPCTKATDTSGIAAAAAAAAAADVAVLFVGLDQTSEAENFDRDTLALPGVQELLALAVLAAQSNTVVVFVSGGLVSAPVTLALARAALQAHYGGELGGDAIVDALFGAFSPAGKLPLTMYFNNITARDIRDVDLASAGGITHSFFSGPVLLPFAFGLSYASFSYEARFEGALGGSTSTWRVARAGLADAAAGAAAEADSVAVVARISSDAAAAGAMASDCVVLVFVVREDARDGDGTARQQLVAFTRLRLVAPGEAREHRFALSAQTVFAGFRDELEGRVAPPRGRYTLRVGDTEAPALLRVEVV